MMSTLYSLNEHTLSNATYRSSLPNHHPTPARQPLHPKTPPRRAQRSSSLSLSRPTHRPIKTLTRNLKRCHPKRFVRGVGRRWRGYWDCDGVYVGLDDWDLHEDGDGDLDEEGRGGGGGGGKVKDGMRMVRSISKMGSRAMRSWSVSGASEEKSTSFTVRRPRSTMANRTSSSSSASTSSCANTPESSPASSRTSSATSLSSFKFKGKPTALFYKVTARLSLSRSLSNDFGVEGEERRQGWWTPARREEGW